MYIQNDIRSDGYGQAHILLPGKTLIFGLACEVGFMKTYEVVFMRRCGLRGAIEPA